MAIKKHYPHVFTPLKVRNLTLKNRILFAPTVCCLTTKDGEVTREYVEYIETQAKTGVSLITIGSSCVEMEYGQDYRGALHISSDADIPGLVRIAEAAHKYGAKISVEMCHAGRGALEELLEGKPAWAPSYFPTTFGTRNIHEMNRQDMERVISAYVDCAVRLQKSGFDMVMIHAAHGNMISQWLSPLTNHRSDIYGGSLENRMRFPMELIKAVREAVGEDYALEIRVSGDEMIEGGMGIEETLEFLKVAQKYVDLVNVSAGLVVEADSVFNTMPPFYHPYMHNVKWAEMAKKVLDIPVSTVGAVKNIAMAEEILSSGKADAVAMARALMADHDIIKKAYRGEPIENCRPCLRCFEGCERMCFIGAPSRCAVNPALCQETKYGTIYPALKKKKVMVVGGGAAGMMATQTLVQRGHDVTLYEQSGELGGHLKDVCHLPFKDDLKQYWKWDVKTTMECGAKIVLNTKVTPELVEDEKPDALFIAVGSKLITPPIPGINNDNVYDVISVDSGKKTLKGDKIVICGAGSSGLECALALAMDGKDVTVVDQIPEDKFGGQMVYVTLWMLKAELKKHGVKLIGNSRVEKFTDKGVEVINNNFQHSVIEADSIITAFGLESNKADVEALRELVYETYIIGDCSEENTMNIYYANHTGFTHAFNC